MYRGRRIQAPYAVASRTAARSLLGDCWGANRAGTRVPRWSSLNVPSKATRVQERLPVLLPSQRRLILTHSLRCFLRETVPPPRFRMEASCFIESDEIALLREQAHGLGCGHPSLFHLSGPAKCVAKNEEGGSAEGDLLRGNQEARSAAGSRRAESCGWGACPSS